MAVTLVVENGTGLANANALASLGAVTAILDAHPFASAWAAKTSDEQNVLIVEGSQVLSRVSWDGARLNETQTMPFPRTGLWSPDGFAIDDASVPAFVVQALARVCLYLAAQTASPFADSGLQPGTELEVGPLRLTPSSSSNLLTPDVRALIGPYARFGSTLIRA